MEVFMLTYSFSDRNQQSLYEYLYSCIRDDILSGNLKPHEKLPSKRAFATHLNVSTITIENTYSQLLAEGYLYSLPKKGYYVAEIGAEYTKHRVQIQEKTEQSEQSAPIFSSKKYFANLVSSQTNPDTFPFSVWAKLLREVISERSDDLMKNPPCGGIYELRKAICSYLYDFRGINADPVQVIIGAGTEYFYLLLIQLLGKNQIFALEEPGYKKVSRIYEQNHISTCFVPLDSYGLSVKELEKTKADILHISPSHHFPTGITMPIARRNEVLSWAEQSETRYIIEDDYDSEFRMSGKPIPTLKSIDNKERVIYMNTFSKTLASTIRISYMVLPSHLAKRFYEQLGFYSSTVSTFEQLTLAHFISKGYFEKHINRMRTYYRNLRDILLTELKKSPLANRIEIAEEDAGLHFLMTVNTSESTDTLLKKADKQEIRISCLSEYYQTPPSNLTHTFLVCYSAIAIDDIPEIVRRLSIIFT